MTDNIRRPFARIFQHEKLGLILVEATTDDEGDDALRVVVDTHPGALNPTAIIMTCDQGADAYKLLADLTEDQAFRYANTIAKLAEQATGLPAA